jgi:hypothetical protein
MEKVRSILFKVLIITMLLDPTNTVLGIKIYLFFMFVVLSINHFNYSIIKTLPLFLYYTTVISGSLSLFMQSTNYDPVFFANYFTTGGILLLLPLLNRKYFSYLVESFILGCVLISLLTIGLFVFFKSTDINLIYGFDFKNTFIVTPRAYMGVPFLMVYHKSVCALLIAVGIVFNRMLNFGFRWLSMFTIIFFILTLYISATRANMLAALVLFISYIFYFLNKKGYHSLSVIMIIFSSCFVIFSVFFLVTFATDDSNSIKYGHVVSIYKYLSEDMVYLFFGMGTGSVFYSSGFGAIVPITEVTYFEFVRSFGLVISPLLFFMFFFPLFYAILKKIKHYKMYFTSYFVFLIVGGTNPLLIGNLGLLILILSYSILVFGRYDKSTSFTF